jgi:hypothetical protein
MSILKNKIFTKEDYISIGVILLLATSRIIPHPPNFTPIIAMSIMSGYFFKNYGVSFTVVLISMLLADVFIGFYQNMFFVYFSLFLITFFSFKITKKINIKSLFFIGLGSSLLFYLISNFGVWMMGSLYSKNINGLIECYIAAIPFFRNTLLSTIAYSYSCFFLMNTVKSIFLPNYFKK